MAVTDDFVEAEKLIKGIIHSRFLDRALDICRWLLSFNNHENHQIKCYSTGGNKPDIRFCIDRGFDCDGTKKIMTNFIVIEPDLEIMGIYSMDPDKYPYFKQDQKRWRIGWSDTSRLSIDKIKAHILESYCLKMKKLRLNSVVCKTWLESGIIK